MTACRSLGSILREAFVDQVTDYLVDVRNKQRDILMLRLQVRLHQLRKRRKLFGRKRGLARE